MKRINVRRGSTLDSITKNHALNALSFAIAATFSEHERQQPDYVERYIQRLAAADVAMQQRLNQITQS